MKSLTINDALYALGCDGGWKVKDGVISGWTCKTLQPTDEEIQAKLTELQVEYEANHYQRDRASAYPSYADQLDTIYHQGLDAWKAEIKKVKDQFPKPE